MSADAFGKAIRDYRDAVARRAFWEDHGSRRDGNLEAAIAAEAAALRALRKAR